MAPSYCVRERKPCVPWVQKYFKDCLCNLKDDFSFSFGLVSLVCWGVAEIPQIITNFHTKSSHGVSLAFLLTWVAGDIFNLVGCLLEPATVSLGHETCLFHCLVAGGGPDRELEVSTGSTCGQKNKLASSNLKLCGPLVYTISNAMMLSASSSTNLPTQLYTALLYTITTIVLVLQSLYYDYIYRWCRRNRQKISNQEDEEERKPLRPKRGHESGVPIPNGTQKTSPAPRREMFYYTSARSLAGSGTPPFRNYMRAAKSGPSALELNSDSSSDDEAPPSYSVNSPSQPRPIPRSYAGGYGTFLGAAVNLPAQGNALAFSARKLLQEQEAHSAFGQWLGWLMAAIYMGGRLPQIWLNIKRGSVEGLNPFMFVFALIANVTYVASILVRTTEWESIKANMPWLLDAVVCVALDLFIIVQYIYYRYIRRRWRREENGGDYKEARKSDES